MATRTLRRPRFVRYAPSPVDDWSKRQTADARRSHELEVHDGRSADWIDRADGSACDDCHPVFLVRS